jgi:hypothetical protein
MDLTPEMKKRIQESNRRRQRHRRSPINESMREFIDALSGNHRLHLSAKKIKKLNEELTPECSVVGKPGAMSVEKPEEEGHIMTGFWYGIDGSWADWCLCEQFRGGERYFYELEIDTSAILTISTIAEFEAFEDEYIGPPPWQSDLDRYIDKMAPGTPRHMRIGLGEINWPKVAEKYAGVEITPYLYEKRLSSHWYYGWDCASGVVWDINAVKEFRLFAAYSPRKAKFELVT